MAIMKPYFYGINELFDRVNALYDKSLHYSQELEKQNGNLKLIFDKNLNHSKK